MIKKALFNDSTEASFYPKIFSPDVNELRKEESPVEGELGDVVPPHVAVDRVMGVVLPAVADVPEPLLAPQTDLERKVKLFWNLPKSPLW